VRIELRPQDTRSAGEGLERSCRNPAAGWLVSARPAAGVELFRAWFAGEAYRRHRHDTYAIGVTDSGLQVFDYRGSAHASLPGQVVVLYPDEAHDGRAGTSAGFGYRIVYVEPRLLTEAARAICGRPGPLPFLREPVSTSALLSRALDAAFHGPLPSLAVDSLIVELAQGLMAGERGGAGPGVSRRVDVRALERARQFLDAERTRVVHSRELESITGLTRYELARQFRIVFGTSPYRYLLMRRLEFARERLDRERPLAEVALDAGFADQAHFTRVFRGAVGLTPARYRALRESRTPSAERAGVPHPALFTSAGTSSPRPAGGRSRGRGDRGSGRSRPRSGAARRRDRAEPSP
jgi:AraC-like DNA-binding protein